MMDSNANERIFEKMQQYRNALRLHCYHVAKARLRDVAELKHEQNPEVTKEAYLKKLLTDHPEVNRKAAPKTDRFYS